MTSQGRKLPIARPKWEEKKSRDQKIYTRIKCINLIKENEEKNLKVEELKTNDNSNIGNL